MSKTKIRKVHVNEKEYGWSVAKGYAEKTEVRIWDTSSKQIIERFEVDEYTQITPAIVVAHIEKFTATPVKEYSANLSSDDDDTTYIDGVDERPTPKETEYNDDDYEY